jgi:hypothetical protein
VSNIEQEEILAVSGNISAVYIVRAVRIRVAELEGLADKVKKKIDDYMKSKSRDVRSESDEVEQDEGEHEMVKHLRWGSCRIASLENRHKRAHKT